MQEAIRQDWYFNQSPQEVWEYLTKPELLEQWLAKMDFQPVVGFKFQILGKNGCFQYCEVLEAKPFTKLSYSWKYSSVNDNQYYDSTVVWTLIPKDNGTELHLLHEGISASEDRILHNNGWTKLGSILLELLNTVEK